QPAPSARALRLALPPSRRARHPAARARGLVAALAPGAVVPLEDQFAEPHGLGGLVAGEVMAWRNRGLNGWTLRLLGVRRTSRVLEVGFGPGVGIRMVAALARRGRIAGVDPSALMVKRARWRNRKAIHSGRVDLRRGDVRALPWPDGAF